VIAALLAVLLLGAGDQLTLVDAARNADAPMLQALLKRGANVNTPAGDGTTALHWASYRDEGDSAELLIRAGANVNAANDLGATPLWLACQNGSEAMVRRLLAAGANPNLALLSGETPLMVAARSGYSIVVELLIGKGANVEARGTRGQTSLMWAVSQKHADVVKVLLQHGVNIHARSDRLSMVQAVTPHGYLPYNRDIPFGSDTALLFAARSGDVASAKLLLAAGANVDDADAWGVSAVTLAAHSGFAEMVELLLESGADPNADGPGFTGLHEAVMRRDERIASALLAYGADPNAPLRTWTPLRRSSEDFNFEPELVGATPFWLAARFSEPGVMRLLEQYGADPLFVHRAEYVVSGRTSGEPGALYETRKESITALMAAAGMGGGRAWVKLDRKKIDALTLEAVKLAVTLGIDVNAANTDGSTALDAATARKNSEVVRFLVENGARAGEKKAGVPRRRSGQ
jgi:ankyrin repeat protein